MIETGPRYWWAKIKGDAQDIGLTFYVGFVAIGEVIKRLWRGDLR